MSMTDDHQLLELNGLLTDRLRVRGRNFSTKMHRARRLLPRHLRADARYLEWAAPILVHPKLSRMVDPTRLSRARSAVTAHLKTIDRKERRKEFWLNWAAFVAFIICLTAGVAIWISWSRGLI